MVGGVKVGCGLIAMLYPVFNAKALNNVYRVRGVKVFVVSEGI